MFSRYFVNGNCFYASAIVKMCRRNYVFGLSVHSSVGLCVPKFVNTISYKPPWGISPNLQFGAFRDKELIRFSGQKVNVVTKTYYGRKGGWIRTDIDGSPASSVSSIFHAANTFVRVFWRISFHIWLFSCM